MAQPSQTAAAAARCAIRTANKKKREEEGEMWKNQGNDLFKNADFMGAAEMYMKALNIQGLKPVLLSNLAMAYIKAEAFVAAEFAATAALESEPTNLKARYRRGVARKELGDYWGAKEDFDIVIRNDPECELAIAGLVSVERLAATKRRPIDLKDIRRGGYRQSLKIHERDSEDEQHAKHVHTLEEDSYPEIADGPWEYVSDSDTDDCKHLGKGKKRPNCKFYNRDNCRKGEACKFSHAPDNKSVRDELGHNVCIHFLLGDCTSTDDACNYLHSRADLPVSGWWNDLECINEAKFLQPYVEDPFHSSKERFEPESYARRNPKGRPFMARYKREWTKTELEQHHKRAVTKYSKKTTAAAKVQPKPTDRDAVLLIISIEDKKMFDSIWGHLMGSLKSQKIKHKQVTSSQEAIQQLNTSKVSGVLASDHAITLPKYRPLLNRLVTYVKGGGRVLASGQFANHINEEEFAEFTRTFGLPWTWGSYHRTMYSKNPSNELIRTNPFLIDSYSMKSSNIGNIRPEQAVYRPTEKSVLQSHVFAPEKIKNLKEAPAVIAPVGRGAFGVLADVNGEVDSTPLLLTMLGIDVSGMTFSKTKPGSESSATLGPNATFAWKSGARVLLRLTLLVPRSPCPRISDERCWKTGRWWPLLEERWVRSEGRSSGRKSRLEGTQATYLYLVHRVWRTLRLCMLLVQRCLVSKLVEYVNSGGMIVFGGAFGATV